MYTGNQTPRTNTMPDPNDSVPSMKQTEDPERISQASNENDLPGVLPRFDDTIDSAACTQQQDILLSDMVSTKIKDDENEIMDTISMLEDKEKTMNHEILSESQYKQKPPSAVKRKCTLCRIWCHQCCKPCLTKYSPLPHEPTILQKMKYAFMCPPHGKLAKLFTILLSLLVIWGTLWGMTGPQALPGGTFFGLLVLFVLCVIGGAITLLIRLPPLLGMLIVGCALRNIPIVKTVVHPGIDTGWSSALRTIALVVILIRAGLGLDPKALRKLSFVVLRLAFLPCLVECITVAIVTNLLLGFPWTWGFMLGFVLAAVSPAVVVPSLLHLSDQGYGVDEGIPTLVIAAASVDDVLAISGFGVVLGITFSEGDLALSIVRGPLEALMGVVFGIVFGIIMWYIPYKKNSENLVLFRTILLFGGGLFAMFGSRAAEFPGAGALAVLTMAFVAAWKWRKDGWPDDANPVSEIISKLWVIFQPLLFGLIGAEVDLTTLDGNTIGLGIGTLFIGLFFRIIASFLAVFGAGLNWKEKFFVPIAWLPKATVQAAIGSVALDTAREQNASPETIELGQKVLTIAVLVIVITAPIGAIAISLMGPRLLKKSNKGQEDIQIEEEEVKFLVGNENEESKKQLQEIKDGNSAV